MITGEFRLQGTSGDHLALPPASSKDSPKCNVTNNHPLGNFTCIPRTKWVMDHFLIQTFQNWTLTIHKTKEWCISLSIQSFYRANHLQTLQRNKMLHDWKKKKCPKVGLFHTPLFFHSRVKIKLILSPIYNTRQIKHPPCSCHFCSVMILVRHENNFLYA